MSSLENTEVVDNTTATKAASKNISLVQRFVEALFSNGGGNSHEDSEDKLQISEVTSGASSNQEKPGSGSRIVFALFFYMLSMSG